MSLGKVISIEERVPRKVSSSAIATAVVKVCKENNYIWYT